MTRVLQSDLFAEWAERPFSAITHRDVPDVVDALVEKGHETAANRYLTYLKTMFACAIKRGILAARAGRVRIVGHPGKRSAPDRETRSPGPPHFQLLGRRSLAGRPTPPGEPQRLGRPLTPH